MAIEMSVLVNDLADEVRELDGLLAGLNTTAWATPTPAPGWVIADQVIHLALFDERACWSMTDSARFHADIAEMANGIDIHAREMSRTPESLLTWWRTGNAALRGAALSVPGDARCDWYGPPMAAASMITARIMETWAHAHDVADALGVEMAPTHRLRHVAHIGVRARAFAYAAHRRSVPSESVSVALTAPNGDMWQWGDDDASQRIMGSARDFCQVVTRRRHVDDTSVVTVGDAAREWMEIAQAFAGPPGDGRRPGQFAR